MGSRLASCRLASHWWYCCMSVRPGTPGCLGLRELHMVPYWPPGEDTHRDSTHHDATSALNIRLQRSPGWMNKHFHNFGHQLLIIMAIFCINSRPSGPIVPLGAEDNQRSEVFYPPCQTLDSFSIHLMTWDILWQPSSCPTPVGPAWLIQWDIYSTERRHKELLQITSQATIKSVTQSKSIQTSLQRALYTVWPCLTSTLGENT